MYKYFIVFVLSSICIFAENRIQVTGVGETEAHAKIKALEQAKQLGANFTISEEEYRLFGLAKLYHCKLTLSLNEQTKRSFPMQLFGVGTTKEAARKQALTVAELYYKDKYTITSERYIGAGFMWQCIMIIDVNPFIVKDSETAASLGKSKFSARKKAIANIQDAIEDHFEILEEKYTKIDVVWHCTIKAAKKLPRYQKFLKVMGETKESAKKQARSILREINLEAKARIVGYQKITTGQKEFWVCKIQCTE